MAKETLTTNEAAAALGVSPPRVRQLVKEGLLVAEKFGRDLAISAATVAEARNRKTAPGPAAKAKPEPATTKKPRKRKAA